MTNRKREIAKFACGAEAFHAFGHALLGFSGTTITVLGITPGPKWHTAGVIVNAAIAILLGVYAWRTPRAGEPDHRIDGVT